MLGKFFLAGGFKWKVLEKYSKAYRCFPARLPTFLPGVKLFYPVEYPVGNGVVYPVEPYKYRVGILAVFLPGQYLVFYRVFTG